MTKVQKVKSASRKVVAQKFIPTTRIIFSDDIHFREGSVSEAILTRFKQYNDKFSNYDELIAIVTRELKQEIDKEPFKINMDISDEVKNQLLSFRVNKTLFDYIRASQNGDGN